MRESFRGSGPADPWASDLIFASRSLRRLARIEVLGLIGIMVPKIMSALSVSEPYALRIRGGGCVPHPRHWLTLARLVGVQPDE